ncbi:MAG: HlyD family efflux transporter periplasmic adaptor subunit [Planctomycetota bacterium]
MATGCMELASQACRKRLKVVRMVAAYDDLTDELQRSCVRLGQDLVFCPQDYQDTYYFHIENPSTSKFYRISYPEYVFVSQFDGKTSYAKAFAISAQTLGQEALTESKAEELIFWLLKNQLATLADHSVDFQTASASQSVPWYQNLNPFWIKLPFGDPTKIFRWLEPRTRWMTSSVAIGLGVLLILLGLVFGIQNFELIYRSSTSVIAPQNLAFSLIIWCLLKILHELAHGIACLKHGGSVRDCGLILVLFAPMAYVDVSSSWRFKSRWKRIGVAAAGMYAELLVASMCLFLWFLTPSAILKQQLVNVIVLAGVTTVLFNANPLMRFDGYYLLSDLLKIPNLFASGSEAFREQMRWVFLGLKSNRNCVEIRNHKSVILLYGYLAAAWKIFICVGLSIAAASLFHGLGIVIAIVGVVSWVVKPFQRIVETLLHTQKTRPHAVVRTVGISICLLITILTAWLMVPNPFSANCPCIVDFQDGLKIRSESFGFVSELHVQDGEWVEKGDPILTITNPELQTELVELKSELEIHQTRERIAIESGDPNAAQLAYADCVATKKLLDGKRDELRHVTLIAPREGKIIIPRIGELVGKFIQKGEQVATINDDVAKEIRLSISPDQVDFLPGLEGKKITVVFGSRRRISAELVRLNPKASQHIDEEKLIAPNGGSLAVHESSPDQNGGASFKLVDPQVIAIAVPHSDNAKSLFAGERGYANLESSSLTLGEFAVQCFDDWLTRQINYDRQF